MTPPGARGRREMSTFGDTSSQVQRRGGHCELTPPGTRGRREMNTFGLRCHLIAGPLLQRDEAAQPTAHVLCRGGRTGPRHGSPRVLVPHAPSQNTTPWARSTALPEDRRAPAPCCGGRGPETPMRLTGRRPASHTAAPVLLLLSAYYIGAAAAAAATAAVARRARSPAAKFPNVSTNTSGSARASARGSGTREAPRPPSARASASRVCGPRGPTDTVPASPCAAKQERRDVDRCRARAP